jgi:DNA modification methylase
VEAGGLGGNPVILISPLIIAMEFRMQERPEWGKLATFVPNKNLAVYNWYYYKEGFSRELVMRLLDMLSPPRGGLVLDPFCGVGTTMLACRERGLPSVGFDVHPVSVFVSGVKLGGYNTFMLRQEASRVLGTKFKRQETGNLSPLVRRAFKRETLQDVLFFRNAIMETADRKARDFLLLGLMNAAMRCSYVYKDGAVIKFRKKPVPPLRKYLKRVIWSMLKEYEAFSRVSQDAPASAGFGDARRLPTESGSVDAIITSPPYLNKIEYTKVYEIEQELFLRFAQELPPLRSYIGLSPERLEKDSRRLLDALGDEARGLPAEASSYLADMWQSIQEMYRVMRKGGRVGVVVGNGCFPGGVVDSDLMLSRMAERSGFSVDKILVLNKRWCTKNRVEKVGITRESLLLWEK